MTEIRRLQDLLWQAYQGDAWYGPSLKSMLAEVTAEMAAARPVLNGHTIWEIVRHLTAWMQAVRLRLEDHPVELPPDGDWPAVTDTSSTAWQQTLRLLDSEYEKLYQRIGQLCEDDLNRQLGSERIPEIGSGMDIYHNLHGVIQHTVYHAGQISLLKKYL